jgi:hypothetical protein
VDQVENFAAVDDVEHQHLYHVAFFAAVALLHAQLSHVESLQLEGRHDQQLRHLRLFRVHERPCFKFMGEKG